jgi:anaerobic dimethyl sulfoxide reductase subunit B (iron-sulfur subunit)
MTGPYDVGFVVDLARCVGCGGCVLACRLENGWAGDTPWRHVIALNAARRAAGPTYFLSVACHHCERPACVRACPSGAYEQRADGRVVHQAHLCVGCRYCEMACPFGAPRYDAARGVMTKCDCCEARAAHGNGPACVAACPTEALQVPALTGETWVAPARLVAGFADPSACRPRIRFKLPRGIRGGRLRAWLGRKEAQR